MRTTKILLSFLLVFGMWVAVVPVMVHACSCAQPPSIEDQLNRKTAIFTGKVLSLTKPAQREIQSSADPVEAQFEVKTVWKGEVGSQTAVYTALSSVSCGYEGFEVNKEYIVYAHGDPDRLETGLCEGTKTLTSAQDDLEALGTGYEPAKLAAKIMIPQEVPLKLSTMDTEPDRREGIQVVVPAISLSLIILLVLFIRRRCRS
ncbi:hypothetical protein [Paenibacillus spongiae]|uniref:Tissue inhibitor of metalloproteinase n=1 Tax=Paenibacillus spongiae TaxID=2909671 RepID=A0ABY5S3Z2_9BACL|nr:hypothetical protein [Paenibacillus spongiae]UVI27270.1 hypothetical protein L1F29_17460 [Paenibacillus spongiae]